ncbi:hypothetical protein BDV41DRAFT_554453 [Aspergillus transmontanensis]|uniref:DUF6594 domain-containing protein n=1 Tax=Aspergillus transmontanensis TaxID=1034304 RepID=A0A5N6VH85_9EURO|nr:hypothetical protein BDV41DRAFT_554453 [Aspergillus transmontanensis]
MPRIVDLEALRLREPEFPSTFAPPEREVKLSELPSVTAPSKNSPFNGRTRSQASEKRTKDSSSEDERPKSGPNDPEPKITGQSSEDNPSDNELPRIDEDKPKATDPAGQNSPCDDAPSRTVKDERRGRKGPSMHRKHKGRRERKATMNQVTENRNSEDEPDSRLYSPRLPYGPKGPFSLSPHVTAEMNPKERQQAFKTSKLSELNFYDRLAAAGISAVYQRSQPGKPLSYNIALNSLQRMVLYDLQKELVDVVQDMVHTQEVKPDSMGTARELLRKYSMSILLVNSNILLTRYVAAAIQDYDYMTEKLLQSTAAGEEDPFLVTTNDILGFCLMNDNNLIPSRHQLKLPDHERHRNHRVVLPGPSRNAHGQKVQWSQLLERLLMGVCGGVALIAPMLIMVLHQDQATALTTTSVATILFAVGLAFLGKNLRGQEVLAAVAAYAAVLVVFVGANSP